MPYLVRKVKITGWPSNTPERAELLPADSLFTGGVVTKKNTLSCWRIADKSELNEAILAIVAPYSALDTIDIVLMDEDTLRNASVICAEKPMKSIVAGVSKRHVDLAELSIETLGKVAFHIVQQISSEHCETVPIADIARIFYSAKASGRVKWENLGPDLRSALEVAAKQYGLETA